MQLIRTSISLPKTLYEELRSEAFNKKKSLNKIMLDRLEIKNKKKRSNKEIMEEMKRLVKDVDTGGIDYKALINEGRRY